MYKSVKLFSPWQMVSLWLEAVLIGQVVQRVGLAIIGHPRDGSSDGQSFGLSTDVLELGLLAARGAIAGLITARRQAI